MQYKIKIDLDFYEGIEIKYQKYKTKNNILKKLIHSFGKNPLIILNLKERCINKYGMCPSSLLGGHQLNTFSTRF